MLGVLRAADDDVELLFLQHVVVGIVGFWHSQVGEGVFEVPLAGVRAFAHLRAVGRGVGTGHQFHLRVVGEECQDIVDVHVCETDSADAVGLGHRSSPFN